MDEFLNSNETSDRFSPKLWARLWPYIKPLKKQVIYVVVTMLLSAAVDAVVPLFMREAINRFVIPRTSDGLFGFTMLYAGVIVFQALTTLIYSRQAMIIEMKIGRE